jgi:hypothetical protein
VVTLNSIAVRLIHNPTLTERIEFLRPFLQQFPDYSLITAEQIDETLPSALYSGGDPLSWRNKLMPLYPEIPPFKILTKGEINVTASHFCALASLNNDWCLILEDDVIPEFDDIQVLIQTIEEIPSIIDIVFLGGGYPLTLVTKPLGKIGKYWICRPPNTNTACAYLLRRRTAIRVMPMLYQFDLPIDVELAYIFHRLNFIVAHRDPYLFTEGSKTRYYSSLR